MLLTNKILISLRTVCDHHDKAYEPSVIAAMMQTHGSRQEVRRAVAELIQKGLIKEVSNGKYRPA